MRCVRMTKALPASQIAACLASHRGSRQSVRVCGGVGVCRRQGVGYRIANAATPPPTQATPHATRHIPRFWSADGGCRQDALFFSGRLAFEFESASSASHVPIANGHIAMLTSRFPFSFFRFRCVALRAAIAAVHALRTAHCAHRSLLLTAYCRLPRVEARVLVLVLARGDT